MDMIEKVARAICDATGEFSWDQEDDSIRSQFRKEAVHAIMALRDPTDEMKVGDDIHWDYACHVCGGLKEGWQAMIDNASAEGAVK